MSQYRLPINARPARFRGPFGGIGKTVPISGTLPSPADVTLHLDAGVGVTHTSNVVSQWNDKSGNSNHATQVTEANKPLLVADQINGLPIIQFNGSSGFMNLTSNFLSSLYTIAIVEKVISVPDFSAVIHQENDGLVFESNKYCYLVNDVHSKGSQTLTLNQFHIFVHTKPSSDRNLSEGYLNGASSITDQYEASFGMTGLRRIARGYAGIFTKLDIAEIVVYNKALGPTERQQLEQYFSSKYGISL